MQYNNIYEVRKALLESLGGSSIGLQTVYEVDLEILKIVQEGGGGVTPEEVAEIVRELTASKVELRYLTQAEYDSEEHFDNILYIITDAE